MFDNGLGKLPGKVHLQVDPACQTVILPARKVPVSVKEKFKVELKRLQDLKVIAPVGPPKNHMNDPSQKIRILT